MPVIVEHNGACYEFEFGEGCDDCSGLGAWYEHEPTCESDFCVGNGDEHSCNGDWLPCPACGSTRRIA